ncbi:HrpF/NolX family T3SS translocon protein [Erwinia oleae]|uniref:HrpF/NolX family T3SS translocon protein n=1 Tax=Erwinia oleae TaxID=796334 RepID=UPI000B31AD8B|nr:HrpF/NolX family T3SS translocon protein [Erwinia oleae]
MRLSGFSPSSFTTTKGAQGQQTVGQQPSSVAAGKNSVISFTSSQITGGTGTTGSSNNNDVLPQNQDGKQSLDTLMSQIMSSVLGLLSGNAGAMMAEPAALPQSDASATQGESGKMPFEQVVTTLGRHEDLLKKPLDREGLEKLRDDPSTPSDAKEALDTLLNDPEMFAAIDPAKNGKSDGKISSKDIRQWQDNPAVKQYADAKAETYTHDYVPSDAKPGSPPREMSSNDAMRELYLYSESLPKNINLENLQKIADGSQDMGKCPPQVAAAAKYFTQHPDQWQQLTGKQDANASVSRDRLCDLAAYNVKLSPQESKAVDTLKNNEDIFFKGGGIKQDKLTKIANDPKNSQEVRDAANLLSQPNSMLFSMLDNGKHGAGGNFFNKANDKNIGKGDLDAFIRKGSNQVAEPDRLSGAPKTIDELTAQQDMATGQETQPDAKKEKGGGIFKLLDILSYVATGLSMLIPGAGAAGLAATAGRAAVTAAVKEGVKQGAKEAVKEGVKEGAHQAADAAKTAATGNQEIEGPRVWAQG